MKRLAIVATSAPLPDLRPPPGALDGDAIRSRLPLPDTGFHLFDVDPAFDLAEQIEVLFEQSTFEPGAPVLFYASCAVAQSLEGELFLCLDPANPETGDAFREIAVVFRDRAPGPVAMILECRHPVDPSDPFRSASVVGAAKEAAAAAGVGRGGGIELLVAARPLEDDADPGVSPLTHALIEALDVADPEAGLTIERFYAKVRESSLLDAVPCFTHVQAQVSLELVPGLGSTHRDIDRVRPRARPVSAAPEPAASDGATPSVASVATVPFEAAPPVALASVVAFAPPPAAEPVPSSRSASSTPRPPAEERSLVHYDPDLPRVILADRAPSSTSVAAAPAKPVVAPAPPPPAAPPPAPPTHADHVAAGDAMLHASDVEGALGAYRRALGMLGNAAVERSDVYVRIGQAKLRQDKRREAIANMEKALQLVPLHRTALETLIALNTAEGDLRGVHSAEERLLATIAEPDARFTRLVEFGARWEAAASDATRARAAYERALAIKPDDTDLLGKLAALYGATGAVDKALATRRHIAELAETPRARATQLFELGKHCIDDLKREELGIELFESALETDPTMLEPLTVIARFFADRQEWSELEGAYRRMLDRAPRIPQREVRSEVTWELCRRLGLLLRDHFEDPAHALGAFEDALIEKPSDLNGRLTAADLARSIGENERALVHLQVAARLDASRAATFHDAFELFQKLRRPDGAYSAASVTMLARVAESRERFVFEEHKQQGVPKLARALHPDAWDLLRARDRDLNVEAILSAITPAAIGARLAQLTAEGRLPVLDPAGRQDLEKTTISIARSFAWASHFLGVAPPAIYLHDDPTVGLVAVVAEEPTALCGGRVLRGRSLAELAFLVGRHLGYHVGGHRLVLYYPSIEELSTCFIAAVKIALPDLPVPSLARPGVSDLAARIAGSLSAEQRDDLTRAVSAFEAAGGRADIASWVGAVERCATRAGHLLCGDLDVAASLLRSDPLGVLGTEEKIADLLAFVISDEHEQLREEMGIALQP